MTDIEDWPIDKLDFAALSLKQLRMFCNVADALQSKSLISTETLRRILQKRHKGDGKNTAIPEYQKIDLFRRSLKLMERRILPEGHAIDSRQMVLFRWVRQQGIHGMTPAGKALYELAAKVVKSFETNHKPSGSLRISISESAATFVLAEILTDIRSESSDSNAPYRLVRSNSNYVQPNGEISRAEIDCAISWDFRFKGGTKVSERISVTKIEESRAPVCLIFHASHPFARWLEKHFHGNDGQPNEPTYSELRMEIAKYPVLYPKEFENLAALANTLASFEQSLPVDGFPSVVAHVRMCVGIGFFPKWPWVLDRLRLETQVYHLQWPADAPSDENTELWLSYYKLNDGLRTKETDQLVERFRAKFAEWSTETPELDWSPVDWIQPFGEPKRSEFNGEWASHYINRGTGKMPYPAWRTGTWEFHPVEDLAPERQNGKTSPYPCKIEGRYHMTTQTGARDFQLDGNLFGHNLQVFSTPLADLRSVPAIISFVQVFQRGLDSAHRIVFGFIQTFKDQIPTVAPFFLCPIDMEIRVRDYRSICRLVEFHLQARPRVPERSEIMSRKQISVATDLDEVREHN